MCAKCGRLVDLGKGCPSCDKMSKEEVIKEAKEDVDALLRDQNAEIGVLLKIIIQGRNKPGVTIDEVFQVLEEFSDSMIAKSPEAALEFRRDVEREAKK